jgi:membrane fusion protein (multidrug efflux system)
MPLRVVLIALAALTTAVGCRRKAPPPPPPPTVSVVVLRPQRIDDVREFLATLDGSVNAEIRPQVTGTIQSVDYQEGSEVKKGALLFSIDKRPFIAAVERAKGDLLNAKAQMEKAQADVRRYMPLVAARAISRQELDNARAAAAAGAATVRSMRGALQAARLNLEWAEVRSPIDGIAGIAQVRVGNLVGPNSVLTVVSTVDPIRASINISEREYLRYAQVLNDANNPLVANRRLIQLVLPNGRIHEYGARRVIVNRQIDPTTGTLLIQTLFENPGNILRPGMFAKVRVRTGRVSEVLVVPEVAVQELQGQHRVTVVDDQGVAQSRQIRLGRQIDHSFIVEEGLRAGERVVVSGAQNAPPGTKVTVALATAER